MSVILIGMPSSGKSTLGVLLAKELGYSFIDADLLIQQSEGRLLHEIIAERGEQEFLTIENKINAAITCTTAVISTGGSAIYCEEAMKALSRLGRVVYLRISLDEMLARLGDYTHRGVVMLGAKTLEQLYFEREALCRRYADVTVDVIGGDIPTTMRALLEKLR